MLRDIIKKMGREFAPKYFVFSIISGIISSLYPFIRLIPLTRGHFYFYILMTMSLLATLILMIYLVTSIYAFGEFYSKKFFSLLIIPSIAILSALLGFIFGLLSIFDFVQELLNKTSYYILVLDNTLNLIIIVLSIIFLYKLKNTSTLTKS